MTTPVRGALAVAATLALILGFAAPAQAASAQAAPAQAAPAQASPAQAAPAQAATLTIPDTLPAIQAAGARATGDRIAAVNRTIPGLTRNDCMSDANQSRALGTLNGALAGMEELRDQIATAADASTAASLYRSVFEDWRVYAVSIPQSLYAASADCLEETAIPALLAAQSKLETALAGPFAGAVTPEIEADMADLAAQIAVAQDSVTGAAATALAVTPADYNANPAVLYDVKVDTTTATSAARLARQTAQRVVEALR